MRNSMHSWKRSASVGLASLVAAMIVGCTLSPWPTLVLDEDDSGSAVTVRVRATLMVVLSGNASTGYEWEVTDLDTAVLEHAGTSSQSLCAETGMVGCGQTEY